MKQTLPALAAVSMLASAASAASAAPPLQPADKWVVDYGETSCSGFRNYGAGGNQVTLAFRPSLEGNAMIVLVARNGRVSEPRQEPARVTLGTKPISTTLLRYGSEDKKFELLRMAFDRAELDQLGSVSSLAIDSRALIDQTFAVPGIAKVLEALDTCTKDLQAYWNADNAGKARIHTPAAAHKPLGAYFSSDDYPAFAVMGNHSGRTEVTLLVDEKGLLKDCVLEDASGVASLDVMSCQVLRERAKFRPALDAEGKPVRSALIGKGITWRMQ